jgi:hypothetical protein
MESHAMKSRRNRRKPSRKPVKRDWSTIDIALPIIIKSLLLFVFDCLRDWL